PGLIACLAPQSRAVLDAWADDELAREQYLDFLCNRTFRRTLLCHADQPRREDVSSEALTSMCVSTNMVPVSDRPDVASSVPEEFRKPDSDTKLATNTPLVKDALLLLYEVHPDSLSIATLWERVRTRLGQAA